MASLGALAGARATVLPRQPQAAARQNKPLPAPRRAQVALRNGDSVVARDGRVRHAAQRGLVRPSTIIIPNAGIKSVLMDGCYRERWVKCTYWSFHCRYRQ
jgi:hypothetical protein